MTAPAPLVFPLAGLLAEPPGTERRYDIEGATIPLPDGLRLAEPIDGRLRVARTNRGVLVDATLSTAIAGTCSRCLRDNEIAMTVEIREEALPTVDNGSGKVLDPKAEPDVARLTDHHELDLATMAGEAISVSSQHP